MASSMELVPMRVVELEAVFQEVTYLRARVRSCDAPHRGMVTAERRDEEQRGVLLRVGGCAAQREIDEGVLHRRTPDLEHRLGRFLPILRFGDVEGAGEAGDTRGAP